MVEVETHLLLAPRLGLEVALAAEFVESRGLEGEHEEAAEAHFVPRAAEAGFHFVQGGPGVEPRHLPHVGHGDAQEPVALAVLPRSRLEETLQHGALFFAAREAEEFAVDLF